VKKAKVPFPDLSLEQVKAMMSALGVTQLLLKELAPNDNSKNQPYVSRGDLSAINILPAENFEVTESDHGNRIMKASMPFEWLQPDGTSNPAPNAKLILYPQYPEIRFSGFLLGAVNAPNAVMTTRMPGRLLLLGVTSERRVIGWAVGPDSQVAREIPVLGELEALGVLKVIPLRAISGRELLIEQLRRIHLLNWIASKRLNRDGTVVFSAQNGIGFTLEAELGILQNGRSEPDFEGWEIKASQVARYDRVPSGTVITMMTPQPDGGLYTKDFPSFMGRFGYADRAGRPDRVNFGGVHVVGSKHHLTSLTPTLVGVTNGKITDPGGKYALVADDGTEAASWSFAKLMEKWNRKHAQAAYVPGEVRSHPEKQYRYGGIVRLGSGTSFDRFIRALGNGVVVYDPGVKVEGVSTPRPRAKHRSQFRTTSGHLASLYQEMNDVSLLAE
jgi:hypothetical protein